MLTGCSNQYRKQKLSICFTEFGELVPEPREQGNCENVEINEFKPLEQIGIEKMF